MNFHHPGLPQTQARLFRTALCVVLALTAFLAWPDPAQALQKVRLCLMWLHQA